MFKIGDKVRITETESYNNHVAIIISSKKHGEYRYYRCRGMSQIMFEERYLELVTDPLVPVTFLPLVTQLINSSAILITLEDGTRIYDNATTAPVVIQNRLTI